MGLRFVLGIALVFFIVFCRTPVADEREMRSGRNPDPVGTAGTTQSAAGGATSSYSSYSGGGNYGGSSGGGNYGYYSGGGNYGGYSSSSYVPPAYVPSMELNDLKLLSSFKMSEYMSKSDEERREEISHLSMMLMNGNYDKKAEKERLELAQNIFLIAQAEPNVANKLNLLYMIFGLLPGTPETVEAGVFVFEVLLTYEDTQALGNHVSVLEETLGWSTSLLISEIMVMRETSARAKVLVARQPFYGAVYALAGVLAAKSASVEGWQEFVRTYSQLDPQAALALVNIIEELGFFAEVAKFGVVGDLLKKVDAAQHEDIRERVRKADLALPLTVRTLLQALAKIDDKKDTSYVSDFIKGNLQPQIKEKMSLLNQERKMVRNSIAELLKMKSKIHPRLVQRAAAVFFEIFKAFDIDVFFVLGLKDQIVAFNSLWSSSLPDPDKLRATEEITKHPQCAGSLRLLAKSRLKRAGGMTVEDYADLKLLDPDAKLDFIRGLVSSTYTMSYKDIVLLRKFVAAEAADPNNPNRFSFDSILAWSIPEVKEELQPANIEEVVPGLQYWSYADKSIARIVVDPKRLDLVIGYADAWDDLRNVSQFMLKYNAVAGMNGGFWTDVDQSTLSWFLRKTVSYYSYSAKPIGFLQAGGLLIHDIPNYWASIAWSNSAAGADVSGVDLKVAWVLNPKSLKLRVKREDLLPESKFKILEVRTKGKSEFAVISDRHIRGWGDTRHDVEKILQGRINPVSGRLPGAALKVDDASYGASTYVLESDDSNIVGKIIDQDEVSIEPQYLVPVNGQHATEDVSMSDALRARQFVISGNPHLVRGGKRNLDPHIPDSPSRAALNWIIGGKSRRTAFCSLADGKWMLSVYAGADLLPVAAELEELGCVEAINLDGGPSTNLVVKGRSDLTFGDDRPITDALLIVPKSR